MKGTLKSINTHVGVEESAIAEYAPMIELCCSAWSLQYISGFEHPSAGGGLSTVAFDNWLIPFHATKYTDWEAVEATYSICEANSGCGILLLQVLNRYPPFRGFRTYTFSVLVNFVYNLPMLPSISYISKLHSVSTFSRTGNERVPATLAVAVGFPVQYL